MLVHLECFYVFAFELYMAYLSIWLDRFNGHQSIMCNSFFFEVRESLFILMFCLTAISAGYPLLIIIDIVPIVHMICALDAAVIFVN